MASQDWNAAEDEDWAELIRLAQQDAGSQRALSRLTGIARSTLQNILSGRTSEPSERTVARLLATLDNTAIVRTGRSRTVVDDSKRWTASKLANLEPPAGATVYQIIGKPSAATGQPSHTLYRDLASSHPADMLLEPGFRPQDVARVVWGFGRRG